MISHTFTAIFYFFAHFQHILLGVGHEWRSKQAEKLSCGSVTPASVPATLAV
jgi:hypothetical protein